MMWLTRSFAFRRCASGAAAVEFAMIGLVLIMFSIGIVEIGRGLYLRNQLSHVIDVAARQVLTNMNASDADLETSIRTNFSAGDPNALLVTLGSETLDGTTFRSIKLNYPLELLIPALSLDVVQVSLMRRVPAG